MAGLVSFVGWAADIPRLTHWQAAGISIQPNACVAAIAAGAALALVAFERTRLAAVPAAVTAGIGAATLFEHASGFDLGIDTLLMFGRQWGRTATVTPGRMGVPASLSWTLFGTAVLLLSRTRRSRRAASAFGLIVAFVAALPLAGYSFGANVLYSLPRLTAISFQTSTILFAVALGLVAAVPEREPMRSLLEHSAAGTLIRRILPLVLTIPFALGHLRLLGQERGLYDTAMGVAMLVLVLVAFLCAVLWWGAAAVRRHENALATAAAEREELLQVTQQACADAERANRAKDEFLAILSHELRSPLNAMLGWVRILRLAGTNEELVARAVATLERNVSVQAQLIEDLLDVTRIASGKLVLERARVDVAAVVAACVESTRPIAAAKQLGLHLAISGGTLEVEGDAARLEQIVGNLLHNAVKFTPEGGSVSVRAYDEAADVCIEVSDTGVGIDEALLPHVFDRFVQSQSSTTRRHGGLGLGLSIVEQLTALHGGAVHASSDGVGRGARFTVRLPRMKAHAGAAEVAPHVPRERETRRELPALRPATGSLDVLVVEDDRDSREALGLALEQAGARVRTVESVREALAAYDVRRPDVIVSDIGMPGEDGYALIRAIRARENGGGGTFAIAVSGFVSAQDREAALAAGFDAHLGKPVEPEILVQRLRAARAQRGPAAA